MEIKEACPICGNVLTLMTYTEKGEEWADYYLCEFCGEVVIISQMPLKEFYGR